MWTNSSAGRGIRTLTPLSWLGILSPWQQRGAVGASLYMVVGRGAERGYIRHHESYKKSDRARGTVARFTRVGA